MGGLRPLLDTSDEVKFLYVTYFKVTHLK